MARHPKPAAQPSAQSAVEVPVEWPLVQMQVHDDGAMAVLVNGEAYAPPPHAPAWRRESYSMILDAITAQLGQPVKVVVTECDGTVYTDIVFPRRRTTAPAEVPAQPTLPSQSQHATRATPPVSVTGSGFLAGEEVAVAPIVAHCGAAPDGQVNALIPQGHVSGVQELALIGRISGTIQLVRAVR